MFSIIATPFIIVLSIATLLYTAFTSLITAHTKKQTRSRQVYLWTVPAYCLISGLTALLPSHTAFAGYVKPPNNISDRNNYRKALRALKKKDYTAYEQLSQKLVDYPLYGYLRYEYLSTLQNPATSEIDNIKNESNNPLIDAKINLLQAENLGKNKKWGQLLTLFPSITKPSTELECFHAEALYYNQNVTQAFEIAKQKWIKPYSQPNECNNLFRLWIQQPTNPGYLAWARYKKAVRVGEHKIADYLYKQFFGPLYKQHADLYKKLRREPQLIKHALLDVNTQIHKNIYYSALRKLVHSDLDYVKEQLIRIDIDQWLTPGRIERIERSIMVRNIRKGLDGALTTAINARVDKKTDNFDEVTFQYFLHRQSWNEIINIIDALPKQKRQSESMQYWYARALENRQPTSSQSQKMANEIYTTLANSRSYYGFLSAEKVNQEYKVVLGGHHYEKNFLNILASYPGVIRAYELFRLNQVDLAEKEWLQVLSTLTKKQKVAATILSFQWGMYHFSINTAVNAKAYNFLTTRFPLAHRKHFEKHSSALNIDLDWLMAVTRQESAFDHKAISSANAHGLMQLIPDTANETADMFNIPYKDVYDLFNPSTNITLGSHYLHWVADRFSNNRVLATASYNAGPHRVETWVQNTGESLPTDIWIELIPFDETRKYVKRVLAYSVVYQHRLGKKPVLLQAHEKTIFREQDRYIVQSGIKKQNAFLLPDTIPTNALNPSPPTLPAIEEYE